MKLAVTLTVRASRIGPVREWFAEHGTKAEASLPAAEVLAHYVYCQLKSNSDWDGVPLHIETKPSRRQRRSSV